MRRTSRFSVRPHRTDTLLDGENVTSNAAIGSATDPSARVLATTLRPNTCSGSHRPDANRVPPAVDGTTNRPYRTDMSAAATSPLSPSRAQPRPDHTPGASPLPV